MSAFNQDALSLTTGEELKCGETINVFSTLRREFGKWNIQLEHSGEKCECLSLSGLQLSINTGLFSLCNLHLCVVVNDRIEREVEEYEERYRGRELPGFINYKTFELMVKQQIKQLEEPAVKKLKDIGGM